MPFAWRPGMTAGRALAVADPVALDVYGCTPDSKGNAVYCLRRLPDAMQTDPNLVLSDLIVGKVDDAPNPPLARLETVIAVNGADSVDFPFFRVGFPVPGSGTIAWSARATGSGPEVLKMQTLGNDASRATVASGVHGWRASPDGARWYWLSPFDAVTGAGTLQSAPYPGGASPVAMAPNTLQYDFPTSTSLLVVDSAKNLLAFADPAGAPTVSTSLDTGVIAVLALSATGPLAYVKNASTTAAGTFADLFVKNPDGTGACTLTSALDAYPFDLIFTPTAGSLAWMQRTSTGYAAQYTRLSDCATMNVGSGVRWVEPLGHHGVLYMDGYVAATRTANMQFRYLVAGDAISGDPATRVSGQVRTFTSTWYGGADIVIYTVNGGSSDDGVYVRAFGP